MKIKINKPKIEFDMDDFLPAKSHIPGDHVMPQREIENVSDDVLFFIQNVDELYSMTESPDEISNAIVNIMNQIAENPELDNLLVPADRRIMIAGMFEVLAEKKEVASAKKAKSKPKISFDMDAFGDFI